MSHLLFEEGVPAAKTKRWIVSNRLSNTLIGSVAWYSNWRRYCFFPAAKMLFDGECLSELAEFCEQATAERRVERAAERIREANRPRLSDLSNEVEAMIKEANE